jgi:hypothetical protein
MSTKERGFVAFRENRSNVRTCVAVAFDESKEVLKENGFL